MRPFLRTCLAAMALFGAIAAYGQLVANSRFLENATLALRDWAQNLPPPEREATLNLVARARARAAVYDNAIVRNHLEDGMVVNRSETGGMLDQCDSLLFSSLRYVALLKLGAAERAAAAWHAIEVTEQDGEWPRHPQCRHSTSRDMLVGLLIALSQQPPHTAEHLGRLMQRIKDHNGYFSNGPIYVSYLTPGLARFLAMLAPMSKVPEHLLPEIIRDGYSTAELEVMVNEQGYEAHLGSLAAWLEMEIPARMPPREERTGTILSVADAVVSPFVGGHLERQRLDWITDQLVETDHTNLFYRYLRLRAAGALTPAVRTMLLTELLHMQQFPADRLPRNCDRHADYIWQREIRAPVDHPVPCTEEYNGVDYLWMVANLLDGWDVEEGAAH